MSSINTNVAAMTALQTLTQTNKSLTETQNRISTGFRVADASDNAAYWSIATTMRSDNAALSTVQDALGLGAATVDVAYTGINSAIKVVDEIKSKLVAARQPGVDRGKIQSEITELQAQLRGIAELGLVLRRELAVGRLRRRRPTTPPRPSSPRSPRAGDGRCRSAPSASTSAAPSCSTPTTSRASSTPRARRPTAASTTRSPAQPTLRHLGPDRQRRRPRRPRRDHRHRRRRHLLMTTRPPPSARPRRASASSRTSSRA